MNMSEPTIRPENPPGNEIPQLPVEPFREVPVHVEEASTHLAEVANAQEGEHSTPEQYFQSLMDEDIQNEIKQNNYSQPEAEQYMQDIQGVSNRITSDIEETLKGIQQGFDQQYNSKDYKIMQRLKVIAKLVPGAGILTMSALSGGGLTSLPMLLSAGLFLKQLLTTYQNGEWGGDGEFKRKLKKQLEEATRMTEAAQEDLKSDLREWKLQFSEASSNEERKRLYEKAILDMSAKAQEIMLDIENPQRRIDKLSKDSNALRNVA